MAANFRFAWRAIRSRPLSSTIIVILLALGIGANTTIFSVVNALLLRTLPVEKPEDLVQFFNFTGTLRSAEYSDASCTALLNTQPASLSGLACETGLFEAVTIDGQTERVQIAAVSLNYYELLGVRAQIGRLFSAGDDSADSIAVLSDAYWKERFHGDPGVIGRTIQVNRRPLVIAGVEPASFHGIDADTGADLRIVRNLDTLPQWGSRIFARLRPGASLTGALQEAQIITREQVKDPLLVYEREELVRIPYGSSILRDRFGTALTVLTAAVAGLLLIVCANVAGLLVARTASRNREIAIRIATGAARWQIVCQLLTESLALAGMGAMLGTGMAYASMPLVLRALPPIRDRAAYLHPLRLDVSPDWRVLAFTFAVCAAATILFSLTPAWVATRVNVHEALKSARSSLPVTRSRSILVAIQVALCMILLLGAGLLVRTLATLRALDPGFDAEHIVTFSLDTGIAGLSKEDAASVERLLLERVLELPGVQSASFALRAMMRGTGIISTIAPEGTSEPPGGPLNTSLNAAAPEYLDTMRIPLVAGRMFRAEEVRQTKPVPVVVNRTFARTFFPDVDPLGKRFGIQGRPDNVIVGVVADSKYRSLREPQPPVFIGPREPNGFGTLHVRTNGDPASLIPMVQKTLASIEPRAPFYEVHTLASEIDASLWQDRLVAWLAGVFGAVAALLAAVGLYGMLAFTVIGRKREIGIRMALGALPAQAARLIVRQSLAPVAAGVLMGLAGFAALAGWIRSLLFGIGVWDLPATASAIGILILVAAFAAAPPAIQAARIDPSENLRSET